MQSPIRSALNKRLGVQDPNDPNALDATPPAPAPAAPGAPAAPPDARPGAQMNVSTGPITTQPVAPPAGPAAPSTPLFGGGLTSSTPYVNNTKQRTYAGADGNTYLDDPDRNSVSGFIRAPSASPQDFIKQYQAQHGTPDLNGLLAAMKAAGYNVSPYMYGSTASHNELSLDGSKYKVISGEDGPTPGWYQAGMNDGGGAGGGFGAAGASASGGVSDYTQKVRDLIMQQLTTLGKPVTADDPSIAPEMQAQGRLLERNRQDRRAAAAERASANGLLNGGQGSGSFEGEVASGYEDKGQQLSGIQAQLFGREIQSRRDKVAQLLQMAQQSGDAESARALQLQMAQMDDQIKRLGLKQQQSQFDDSFGLQGGEFQYQKDRDLANAGLGR